MAGEESSGFTEEGESEPLVAAPIHHLPCTFGDYRLDERLAVGGMAEVFLATRFAHAGFERRVVVKQILPHLAQKPRFVEMFLREAKLVAQLDHPNIVSVFDFGVEDGAYFLAMEYVEGLSLRDIRRRCQQAQQPTPLAVVVRAIADAALALDAVHRHADSDGQPLNLVHRDISPDNIVLSASGKAKLLDFGIAKSDGEDSLTQTGELKGKIPYMAPEQISGDAVDSRSDLYALGASLYTLVCGRRPIEAKTDLLALSAIMNDRPTAPRSLRADIPLALELLMLRLLEKKKERRPQTAMEVHDALLRAVPAANVYDYDTIASIAALPDDGEGQSAATPFALPETTPAPSAPNERPPEAAKPTATATVVTAASFSASEENEAPVVDDPSPTLALVITDAPQPSKLPVALAVAAALLLLVVTSIFAAMSLWPEASPSVAAVQTAPSTPKATTRANALPAEPVAKTDGPEPDAKTEASEPEQKAARSTRDKRSRRRRAPSSGAAAKAKVKVVGPAHLRWMLGSKTVGKGTTTLDLRSMPKALVAVDDRKQGKVVVPVVSGVAQFSAVAKGTVSLRVLPFAKVYLGRTFLGETPLAPFKLPAGTYTVRFVGESKKESRRITVGANSLLKVKVDLTK